MAITTSYKCEVCQQKFSEENEEIYCICNLIIEKFEEIGSLHWRWIKTNGTDKVHRVEFYFHRKCFESIAGNTYLAGFTKPKEIE